ncbi:GSCFA domain-containing protein [Streptomyces camelliae]|uniref:GSCFA domain-containing protein n=1 Tax=Streptomyces camelliae TaxID=3004093 RepID=A0ABY7NZL7_9ACTN|nr:GSCFA domain-containing protein [Streptomyces sp. HUAS 2-6]WBO61473.1 GSCFA domain-containing protein [Streptomyces sp. HUAS 2-6]
MNPYQSLPVRSFWRPAVAEPEPLDIEDVWTPKFALGQDDPVVTAGSCFAAQIGRALLDSGMNWLDAEPAPPGLTRQQRQDRGYGAFSFRTGNIYTPAVLRQWLSWALGHAQPPEEAWSDGDRYVDPFRPAIEPDGFASPAEMLRAREVTLAAIRTAVTTASCLVFTMGLTEAWRDTTEGTVHPTCPGTVRGTFDAERYTLHNFTFAEAHRDMTEAIAMARRVNHGLRILLTVSPQPLTATATGGHALPANGYTKSVLRAVAGQLTLEEPDVDYFPSYELITGPVFGGRFFGPNQRTVTPEGVDFVMRHFVAGLHHRPTQPHSARDTTVRSTDAACEDAVLDYYSPR